MGHAWQKTRSLGHLLRFKHSAWCPLSNSSSFHLIFTKLGHKFYLGWSLGQVRTCMQRIGRKKKHLQTAADDICNKQQNLNIEHMLCSKRIV